MCVFISAAYIAMLSYLARILRISTITGLKTSGNLRIIGYFWEILERIIGKFKSIIGSGLLFTILISCSDNGVQYHTKMIKAPPNYVSSISVSWYKMRFTNYPIIHEVNHTHKINFIMATQSSLMTFRNLRSGHP